MLKFTFSPKGLVNFLRLFQSFRVHRPSERLDPRRIAYAIDQVTQLIKLRFSLFLLSGQNSQPQPNANTSRNDGQQSYYKRKGVLQDILPIHC